MRSKLLAGTGLFVFLALLPACGPAPDAESSSEDSAQTQEALGIGDLGSSPVGTSFRDCVDRQVCTTTCSKPLDPDDIYHCTTSCKTVCVRI